MSDVDERPEEFIAELALGVLPEDDAAIVLAYLEQHPEARAEYDAIRQVAAVLPLAATDMGPSAAGRDSLLERLRQDDQPATPVREPIRPRWGVARWAGPIAASVLLISLAAIGGFAWGSSQDSADGDEGRAQPLVMAAANGQLDRSEADTSAGRVVLLRAPGALDAFAVVDNLPPLEEGKAYQAWFTKDGTVFQPSDTFSDASGNVWLSADEPLEEYAAFGLTIEDEGGAETPSSAPFIAIEFDVTARTR